MLEITAMRHDVMPRGETEGGPYWKLMPQLHELNGSWKSDIPMDMCSFDLADCPPYEGWQYGGRAIMVTKEFGGTEGSFVSSGGMTKVRQ